MSEVESNEAKTATVTRRSSPENQSRLAHILERTNLEPGVTSPAIAKELEITTLQTSQLADRLVKAGEIQLVKVGPIRTYYPKGFDISALPGPSEAPASEEAQAE